ncbi:uncharacterized protein LOC142767762 [Rhipicephalus microplus]|uniref:uncharacterized protein LOC142767762 n=1 Tax=Rhipicephalus microplus TaxID=6941 RepID=UPI003F6B5962
MGSVPDNEKLKGQKFLTAMHDMSKTESGEFEYRVLFRPMDDNPAIAVGLEDDTGTFAMEVGVSQSYAYGALRNNKNWNRNDRAQIADNYYLQKGEYYVMNMKLKTPYGPNKGGTGIINEVEFMVNGMVASHKPRFESDDLLGVARYLFYHASTFDKIEVLEHHFRYNGITKSLAPHPTEKVYNIFSYNNIFQMTYGGYAVIRGKFQNTHASIKGNPDEMRSSSVAHDDSAGDLVEDARRFRDVADDVADDDEVEDSFWFASSLG